MRVQVVSVRVVTGDDEVEVFVVVQVSAGGVHPLRVVGGISCCAVGFVVLVRVRGRLLCGGRGCGTYRASRCRCRCGSGWWRCSGSAFGVAGGRRLLLWGRGFGSFVADAWGWWFPEWGGWPVADASEGAGPLVGAVGQAGVGPAAAILGPVVVLIWGGEVVGVGGAAGGLSWVVGVMWSICPRRAGWVQPTKEQDCSRVMTNWRRVSGGS